MIYFRTLLIIMSNVYYLYSVNRDGNASKYVKARTVYVVVNHSRPRYRSRLIIRGIIY